MYRFERYARYPVTKSDDPRPGDATVTISGADAGMETWEEIGKGRTLLAGRRAHRDEHAPKGHRDEHDPQAHRDETASEGHRDEHDPQAHRYETASEGHRGEDAPMPIQGGAAHRTDPGSEREVSQERKGQLMPGTMLDHFKVIRLIGRGGMGEAYLARDMQLGRKVVLKVILTEALGNEISVKRFLREAQITARFSHPHIVTIYSVGEHEGSLYLALEYLPGQNLRERLNEDRPGIKEAMRFGLAIAEALAEAHRHGVLHRDLKPGNVLVPRDGRLRVLDFGLSRAIGRQEMGGQDLSILEGLSDRELGEQNVFETMGGGLRGTPAYMAPEQWMEKPEVEATDTWALGLILYELVGGRHPFEGKNPFNICLSVCQSSPVPPMGELPTSPPTELLGLIDRCLSKDPSGRPTAEEVVGTLSALISGATAPGSVQERNPFRGLLPFSERHAERFFGRDEEIASFLERLREEPLLPVVGPSGAGKSSFVQAGVIPRLREQGPWVVLRMRPGRRPFETLATRLMSGETVDVARGRSDNWSRAPSYTESDGRRVMALPELAALVALPDRAAEEPTEGGATEPKSTESSSPSEMGIPALSSEGFVSHLAAELSASPSKLHLLLAQMAEQKRARVLLFVDQLEELFALSHTDEVRQSFLEAICRAADDPEGPVRVIFTLRDDFLGRLASSSGAREALSRVQVLGTPGRDALREILTRPVEAAGYGFEDPELVETMVRDVADEPAALPLLQFTGQILWEHRDRKARLLTRQAYLDAGGVGGALAKHADGVVDGMAPAEERIARHIFLRLVTPEGTRQVLPRSKLLEGLGAQASQVLDRLTAHRTVLVRKGLTEAEMELVHESLIQKWGRLTLWLEESREERVFLAEIGQAATLWDQRGRLGEEAWQGDALGEALRRAARFATLPTLVADFLQAGERRERVRRKRRRILLLAGAGILVLVAMASLAVSWALRNKEQAAQRSEKVAQSSEREAQKQRRQAVLKEAEAQREGARAALMRGDLLEARAKLRGSLQAHDSALGRSLWWRLRKDPLLWKKELGGVVFSVALNPAGDMVAVACQDRSIYLFDVQTSATRILRGHRDQVLSVAFSPSGRLLASGSWDGVVRLWQVGRSGSDVGHPERIVVQELHGHSAGVESLSFSPDGKLLASSSMDHTVRLWKVDAGQTHAILKGHQADVRSTAFSPDGSRLASASQDGTARIWAVSTGETQAVLKGHTGGLWGVDFHPSGKVVATAGIDGTVRIWDVATGAPGEVLRGHEGGAFALRFSPDGAVLATGCRKGRLRLWRWKEKELRSDMAGHRTTIVAISFSRDGTMLATGSYDRSVRLWRPTSAPTISLSGGHSASVIGASFSPDGRLLATGSLDKEIRLWHTSTGDTVRILRGHDSGVYALGFSPNGELLASGSTDGTVRLWEVDTGQAAAVLPGHGAPVTDVQFRPDGKLLASAAANGTIRIWDVASRRTLMVLTDREASPIRSVAFHPRERTLATGCNDGVIRLWPLTPGAQPKLLRGHTNRVTGVAFSQDGSLLVSGSWDQTVRVWNLATLSHQVLGRELGRIYWADFHPDGRQVGAASSDGTARVWTLQSTKLRVLSGHRGEVNFLRFSPNGQTLATTGDDGTLQLWSVASGQPLWRAPLLLPSPVELFSHVGRRSLDGQTVSDSNVSPQHPPWSDTVLKMGRRASVSENGSLLCLSAEDGRLEIWNTRDDKALVSSVVPENQALIALPQGCVTLSRPSKTQSGLVARLYDPRGAYQTLQENARAVSPDGDGVMVATGNMVHLHDGNGALVTSYPTGVGVTAMTRVSQWLVLGFQDGNIELVPTEQGIQKPRFTFEGVPSSPVTRLLGGPSGTIIAGFANGLVGLWTLDNGTLLENARLHGAILHLLRRDDALYAASELGQFVRWDLGVFHQGYCELVGQIFRSIPMVWEHGLPKLSPPPEGHPCATHGE